MENEKVASELVKLAKSVMAGPDKKVTKQQWMKAEAAVKAAIAHLKDAQKAMNAAPDVMEMNKLDDSITDFWNNLNDAERNGEELLRSMEKSFRQQDWSAQDWAENDLVQKNID